MTSRDFCFWLQGYLEISAGGSTPDVPLTAAQVDCVQRHLALVFKHEIDPSMGGSAHQQELNEVHEPTAPKPAWHRPPGPGGTLLRC